MLTLTLHSHTQILPSALRITTYCPVASSRNTERTASSPRPPHMMMSYLRITTSLIIKASHIGTTDTLPIARCRFPLHACRRRYHFFCTSWKQNNNSFLCKTIMPFSPSTSLSFCLPQRASTRPHIWNQNSICIKTETQKGQGKGLVHFTHGKIHSLSTTRHLTYRTVPFSIARMSTEISLLLFIDILRHQKAARGIFSLKPAESMQPSGCTVAGRPHWYSFWKWSCCTPWVAMLGWSALTSWCF